MDQVWTDEMGEEKHCDDGHVNRMPENRMVENLYQIIKVCWCGQDSISREKVDQNLRMEEASE